MDNLGGLLAEACEKFATATALDGAGRTLNYRQLADAAAAIKRVLRDGGLTPDEPVLVPAGNEPRDFAALMGVWLAGGVAVPVGRNVPPAAIETTRAAAGARFFVTNINHELVTRVAGKAPPRRSLLEGAAIIVFTSGSAGQPKGVVLSHRAFAGKLEVIDSILRFTPCTRALLVLQITFIFGMWVSLLTLLRGGLLLMHARFEPLAILTALRTQCISDAAVVPTMLRKFLSLDEAVSKPLMANITTERILTGGEPFGRDLSKQLRKLWPNVRIVDIYGLTETCSSDFFLRVPEHEQFAETIGHPSPGVQIRLADNQGCELPVNTAGELQIRTPFIMNGYLDEPDLTHAAFTDGFFRTGDLARLRDDGRVELIGRIKDLIFRGGAKISPLELDNVFVQHPNVSAALTAGIPDTVMGERIHVLLVPRANASIDEKELREWIAGRIEKFKWPDVYHFGRELPTGRTGKVDRGALRHQILSRG